MHKGQEGANMKICYEFHNDGCKWDNMSCIRLLRGLLLEKYFLKSLQKSLNFFLCYCVKVM
jgi:hypothetical protein